MSLVKRRGDLDLVDWLGGRGLLDWPVFRELAEQPAMRIEEFEEGGKLVVRAEMPGLDPEKDVDISVTDGMLRINAERRQETRSEDAKGYRSEFSYGSFSRTMRLPTGATEADIKATYTDGILEVVVPIDTEEAKARKVPVTKT